MTAPNGLTWLDKARECVRGGNPTQAAAYAGIARAEAAERQAEALERIAASLDLIAGRLDSKAGVRVQVLG